MFNSKYISSVTPLSICYTHRDMCGAYGFSIKNAQEVYDRFSVVNTLEDFAPRFNVRPGQMNPVITAHSPNKISRMFWGLLPHFAKDERYRYKTINAKAE